MAVVRQHSRDYRLAQIPRSYRQRTRFSVPRARYLVVKLLYHISLLFSNYHLHTMSNSEQYTGNLSRASYPYGYGGNDVIDFLYDPNGNRKYINARERRMFLRAARKSAPLPVFTFCLVLAFTGARISEVLALTPRQIDMEGRAIVFRSLKKRRKAHVKPIYRSVPVPSRLLRKLDAAHDIKEARRDVSRVDERIWPWCRRTATTRIQEVMHAAEITGIQATARGLRHGFAVGALVRKVPLVIVQQWLGHARLETTAIYTKAVAAEARSIANQMWGWGLRLGIGW